LIVLAVILVVPVIAALILMTHTQFIVGSIQKLSAGTVNTKNSYEPLGETMEGVKDNGQYIITEIKYSDNYPNSFLDITYPDKNRETSRPTLIYFHGGGFFGGSKSVGDPLAESDATALLDDICAEGFNLFYFYIFINAMEVREDDEEFQNPVDIMFEKLENQKKKDAQNETWKVEKL